MAFALRHPGHVVHAGQADARAHAPNVFVRHFAAMCEGIQILNGRREQRAKALRCIRENKFSSPKEAASEFRNAFVYGCSVASVCKNALKNESLMGGSGLQEKEDYRIDVLAQIVKVVMQLAAKRSHAVLEQAR